MADLSDLSLAEVNAQIELLEVVENFGTEVQEFTDWMANLSGGNVTDWLSDDPTVQFELGQLKDAAFEFSETLSGFAENFEPLTNAAGTAGDINTVVQAASSLSTAIGRADEAVGAEKANQLSAVVTSITDLSQLLTGLSLNPVIGVFFGLYAVALQNAAIGIALIEDYTEERNAAIDSRGGEIDVEAELAAQEAEATAAEEAELALSEQLGALYARRGELIADLQGEQYIVALDYCASRHRDEMRELIRIASEHGGIPSNAPINGETLGALENWVGAATNAAFTLMTEAAAAPEGSEARQEAVDDLNELNGARRQVTEGLAPLRECVKDALETYGYSTADPVPPIAAGAITGGAVAGGGLAQNRSLLFGGLAILAIAAVGVAAFLFGGGDDAGGVPASSSGSAGTSSGADNGSSSNGASGAGAVSPELAACEQRREEQLVLDFSSPEISGGIPDRYFQRSAYELGFPTPPFEWSAAPEEATEIVILILRVSDEVAAGAAANPALWWEGRPSGQVRWLANRIPADATSLPGSALDNPLPGGVTEVGDHSPIVDIDGEPNGTKFVGPDINGRDFLFTVFALCGHDQDLPLTYNEGSLVNNAVAIGWFIAEGQR